MRAEVDYTADRVSKACTSEDASEYPVQLGALFLESARVKSTADMQTQMRKDQGERVAIVQRCHAKKVRGAVRVKMGERQMMSC